MISALASAMSGQKKVEPLLRWDERPELQSEAREFVNALKLEAVLQGAIRRDV